VHAEDGAVWIVDQRVTPAGIHLFDCPKSDHLLPALSAAVRSVDIGSDDQRPSFTITLRCMFHHGQRVYHASVTKHITLLAMMKKVIECDCDGHVIDRRKDAFQLSAVRL